MTERWVPVVGAEQDYEVSTCGRVRSLTRTWIKSNGVQYTRPGKLLACAPDEKGYPRVRIGKRDQRVHCIMAEAFIGPRPDGNEARHLNDIPSDNRIENIAWGTSAENSADMVRNGHNNVSKTECPRGHAYAGRNLIIKYRKRKKHAMREDLTKKSY